MSDDVFIVLPQPETTEPRRTKTIWREPTPDDPRRRVYRQPEEMRACRMDFRLTQEERNALHRYAQAHKTSASYLVRAAVEQAYPELFTSAVNKNIRPPRKKPYKPRTVPEKSTRRTSFVDDSVKVEIP